MAAPFGARQWSVDEFLEGACKFDPSRSTSNDRECQQTSVSCLVRQEGGFLDATDPLLPRRRRRDRVLPKMTGIPFDGSEAAYRRVAEEMPLVALSVQ